MANKPPKKEEDRFDDAEAQRRFEQALRGAAKAPRKQPTPRDHKAGKPGGK